MQINEDIVAAAEGCPAVLFSVCFPVLCFSFVLGCVAVVVFAVVVFAAVCIGLCPLHSAWFCAVLSLEQ